MAIVYFVLAYWAVGETVYKNKIRIGGLSTSFCSGWCSARSLALY